MFDECIASIEPCAEYPKDFPFDPGVGDDFPEYPFQERSQTPNAVYAAIRKHFRNLGLDTANFGTAHWNPLGDFDLIGKRIVIKPNWVLHQHPEGQTLWCLITHPAFIRAVLDYIYIATQGQCTVTVGDGPIQSADFAQILQQCRMLEMQGYFAQRGLRFSIEDFRIERAYCDSTGIVIRSERVPEDVANIRPVDLKERSLLCPLDPGYRRYRNTNYDKNQMLRRHAPGKHEYLISNAVLECDLLINLPKMKTHSKAGVTLSLKNLVGINGSKDCLPHHRQGAQSHVSDEYEKFYLFQWLGVWLMERGQTIRSYIPRMALIRAGQVSWFVHAQIRKIFGQKYFSEGSWHGNDTVWRTCLDLNRVLFFADKNGALSDQRSGRKYITIIDGVIGGERNGPLRPTPISSAFSVAAFNPCVSDYVSARAMGLNPESIPIIRNSYSQIPTPLCDQAPERWQTRSSRVDWNSPATSFKPIRKFEPASGWKGHIELA